MEAIRKIVRLTGRLLLLADRGLGRLFILFVRIYRLIAPSLFLTNACRFTPSCSEYAILALKKHGFVWGGVKSIGRFLRCRPPYGGEDWP